jgi:hypothetical protein
MRKPPRSAGHTLVYAGTTPARFDPDGQPTTGRGSGRCSCGASSPPDLAVFSIFQWHRDHRLDVLAGDG